jgi:hypothetical protein
MRTLHFRLRIVTVYPRFEPVIRLRKKPESEFARSRNSSDIDRRSPFCSCDKRRGTNFALTRLVFKFFVNTTFTEPNEMLKASNISRIVNLLFARIISLIFDKFSSVVEVYGRLERCSSLIDSAPPRKRSNYLYKQRPHKP